MISRSSFFFLLTTGTAVLSAHTVVGFASPPLPAQNGYASGRLTTSTVLRYIAEGAFPNDAKIVDVEVERKIESVYIPVHEMEDAVAKAQENYDQDAATMQNTINEQREEIQRLKEQKQKSELKDRLHYDHRTENAEVNWGENHDDKMKRATERVRYLTGENQRLQAQLDEEQERFEFEKGRLHQKLEEARAETLEAEQILGLERSYFETATRLLEIGLERETNNVKQLEDQLLQYNEQGYYNDHDQLFHDDLSPFETWEATGAYHQQPDPHHQFDNRHRNDDVYEDFQPQVRPQEGTPHYHEAGQIHTEHDLFQHQEPPSFHGHHDRRTTQQHHYPDANPNNMRQRPTATTTVMDADSIRANLGINDIRDPLYR